MDTVVLEGRAAGGALRRMARVEGVHGYPVGLTGAEFTARAVDQARRWGARIVTPARVRSLETVQGGFRLRCEVGRIEGEPSVHARAVLLAMGAEGPLPGIPGAAELLGAGVYTTVPEGAPAPVSLQSDVFVAGDPQEVHRAVLRLASLCRGVTVVTPGTPLWDELPGGAPREIRAWGLVRLRPHTEVVAVAGVGQLEAIVLRELGSGRLCTRPASALYLLPKRIPRADWLPREVEVDDRGFVRTTPGAAARGTDRSPRPPRAGAGSDHETTLAGVFAAGAVRSGASAGAGAAADGLAAAGAILMGRQRRIRSDR
jgi:thioredoxin reductase (NADPH)